jgi:MFS family permease
MGLLTYGYDSAFIGTTITQKSFKSDFGLVNMTKVQQNAVSSNLTSICTTAKAPSLHYTDHAGANVAANRLRGRILRRFLYVLFHGATWAKENGRYIRRDIYPWSVSAVPLSFPKGYMLIIPCSILCTVPTHQLGLIYAGRLLTGLGVGGLAAVSPIYTSEIAPPAIRGRLTGLYVKNPHWPELGPTNVPPALSRPIRLARSSACMWTLPTITFEITDICSWINYGVVHNINGNDSKAWRIPSKPRNTELGERTLTYLTVVAVQLIPAGLLALMLPLVTESPVWLLKKGRDEDAYRVYSYIRNLPADHQYIAEDVSFVKGQIESERAVSTGGDRSFTAFLKGALKLSLMKGVRNRFVLVFLMFMWQAWSGAAAINYCKSLLGDSPSSSGGV